MTIEPIIGVTTRYGNEEWIHENTRHYLNVLNELGAESVILSPDTPVSLPDGSRFVPDEAGRLPDDLLARLDGLILSGGGDVHPCHFGQAIAGANPEAIDLKRDALELNLARRALEIDLPTFGICRGCQVMNVAAGGGMVQHFDGHRSNTEDPQLHEVVFAGESSMRSLVEADVLAVNTYHHQGMSKACMAPIFHPVGMAETDDWLVEAFESKDHRWAMGVQWHPERLFELPDAHRRLWQSFLNTCKGP